MAEFKISRLRYKWRGNWTTASYNKDDVVRYGGSSWVCIRQHTATVFLTDQNYTPAGYTAAEPAWTKMTDGHSWQGEWVASANGTLYNPGDLVRYAGNVYLCVTSHSRTENFSTNADNWSVYSELLNFRGNWAPATRYGLGDVIRYGARVYKCVVEHTSSTVENGLEASGYDLLQDSTLESWEVYYDNVEFKGQWTASTRYKANDLVLINGSIFKCHTHHTSASVFQDDLFWNVELSGQKLESEWDASVPYAQGSVVRHGGYLYFSSAFTLGINPSVSSQSNDSTIQWNVISKGINVRGEWTATSNYKTGDVVTRGGNFYVALSDTESDGSSLDYLESNDWELLIPGINWRNTWTPDTNFALGDVVTWVGTLYKCNLAHTSDSMNFPGDNGSGYAYWDTVLLAGPNTGLQGIGDLLTFDLSRTASGDGSTYGVTSIPVGAVDHLVSINSSNSVVYRQFDNQRTRIFHVAPDGVDEYDSATRGTYPEKPFKTIRFAALIADDGFAGTTTVSVEVGKFQEITPIIVPAKTVILGSELRSTTVFPNPARSTSNQDYTAINTAIVRFINITQDLVQGNSFTKTVGNTTDQDTQFVGSTTTGNLIVALLENLQDYLDFYILGTGLVPDSLGNNTLTTDNTRLIGASVLLANRNFLIDELSTYLPYTFPSTSIDNDQFRLDCRQLVDALIYDLRYPGNYKTKVLAEYFKNFCLGSVTQNMFLVRDATGVRNMTLSGITGTLSPPIAFELYRRPTAGAYVSLDPGWGPNDNRTWISTRSPYIQGVTTIGTSCVGQKIDGSLHAGGNKSIVSNDFTQVLSDGIGAWVTNNGRAELVSVFTYYCQIGYFAEDGGVIRATNGNCSYGDYGAIADGNDPAETPTYGAVNNRTQDAQVAATFAGEASDEILAFEFDNAGSQYTSATYNIVGSGTGANVLQEDFRDKAIFNILVMPPTAIGAVQGGGSYSLFGGNAQSGNTTTITLASNDTNTSQQMVGLRIIIISGTGTGQYGYIESYNASTKVATVYNETTSTIGWDHIYSGYPITSVLDTTTRYRIEPRVVFSSAGDLVSQRSVTRSANFSAIAYGETTATFTGVQGTIGQGEVVEDDGLEPITASWNVSRVGRTYTVTINDPGAGYLDEQTVVILGENLGGVTPDNNIRIQITAVSDDSTNSITEFTYTGIGPSGVFVATTSDSDTVIYSSNVDNWAEAALPSSGNWKCLAAGAGKFVALRTASTQAASSTNGVDWTARTLPAARNWSAVTFGSGVFVAIAEDLNAGALSKNGTTWSSSTLPTVGDSTISEWIDITYGQGKFVAISKSNNSLAIGTYDTVTETLSWEGRVADATPDSSQADWVSIAYGNGRFVIMSSQGKLAYSFDLNTWYADVMPTQDGSTVMTWTKLRYGNGLFVALCNTGGAIVGNDPTSGPTVYAVKSSNAVNWNEITMATQANWKTLAFGSIDTAADDSTSSNNVGTFVAIADNSSDYVNKLILGTTAKARAIVEAGKITTMRIWDGGGNYLSEPTITLIDPNNTTDAVLKARVGDGVLAQPTFINRGTGYRTSSTVTTIAGDGFADIIPVGKFVYVDNLSVLPGPGTQFRFGGIDQVFTVQAVEFESTNTNGTLLGKFRITPFLDLTDFVEDNAEVNIRIRYSQCRITGHDFLDIGTGNFEQTNYPELYSAAYQSGPENETLEANGGRVFYTSTDQSGNFRTGELFAVEQASGVVTISADYFDLQGLTELSLGGIRFGSGVVIREFSTDALFTADSNNVVPTQKAIKAYLSTRLSVGGAEVAVPSFIAGQVSVGPAQISTTTGVFLNFPVAVNFNNSINGRMLAEIFFYQSFR